MKQTPGQYTPMSSSAVGVGVGTSISFSVGAADFDGVMDGDDEGCEEGPVDAVSVGD